MAMITSRRAEGTKDKTQLHLTAQVIAASVCHLLIGCGSMSDFLQTSLKKGRYQTGSVD
jgi:major membrane immunogen (membrane-anchored lipoprotein)